MTGLELTDAINTFMQDVVATLQGIDDALDCIPSDTAIIAGMLLAGCGAIKYTDQQRFDAAKGAVELARIILNMARQSNPARVVADMKPEGNGNAEL